MHSRDPKNYYVLLGLDPYQRHAYNENHIKDAYRKRALEDHPDKNINESKTTEDKFKEIYNAYIALMDGQIRVEYNEDLLIEDPRIFAERYEQRKKKYAKMYASKSYQSLMDREDELKNKKREEYLAQLDREVEEHEARFGAFNRFCELREELKKQKAVDSTHSIIKLLVSVPIALKLLPRMLIEAFFGIFVIPEFVIFATEQAFSHIVPGINPEKSFHPIVRGLIILLTLCLLPLVMLIGFFVLPYIYFNINERAEAAETYKASVLFFQSYFSNKIVETLSVAACFAIAAALFVIYPPTGLVPIFGTGGTIATYLGLETVSKTVLVSIISGSVAVAAAIGNFLIDKIKSYFPKQYPEMVYTGPKILPDGVVADEKDSQNTSVLNVPDPGQATSLSLSASIEAKSTENVKLITPLSSEWAELRAKARLASAETKEVQLGHLTYLRFLPATGSQDDEKSNRNKNEMALVPFRHPH